LILNKFKGIIPKIQSIINITGHHSLEREIILKLSFRKGRKLADWNVKLIPTVAQATNFFEVQI